MDGEERGEKSALNFELDGVEKPGSEDDGSRGVGEVIVKERVEVSEARVDGKYQRSGRSGRSYRRSGSDEWIRGRDARQR